MCCVGLERVGELAVEKNNSIISGRGWSLENKELLRKTRERRPDIIECLTQHIVHLCQQWKILGGERH